MTVAELEENTTQSSFSLWLEQSAERIAAANASGKSLSAAERELLSKLRQLINGMVG